MAGAAGRAAPRGLRIVSAARTPPATQRPAEMNEAIRNPAENVSGCRYEDPVRPAAAGSTATAIKLAALATSLLIAEAAPAFSAGAAARTVDVSGATLMARPMPKTRTAGRTSVR